MQENLIQVLFKRSPMHESELAGHAVAGSTLEQVFGKLPEKIATAIAKSARVFISNPESETRTIEASDWKRATLVKGDRVTIVIVPALGFLAVLAINFVVGLALSYLLRPNIPKPSVSEDGGGSLFTFGGQSNDAEAYTPIPASYGTIEVPLKFVARPAGKVGVGRVVTTRKFQGYSYVGGTRGGRGEGRSGGERVAKYSTKSEFVDDDQDFLRVIGTFGPGPLVIEDILVGDVPIDEIDADYFVYHGDLAATPSIPYYTRTNRTESVLRDLNATSKTPSDDDWVTFRTLDNPVEARFDIAFPGGLYYTNKKNRKYATRVDFQYQWKNALQDNWQTIKSFGVSRKDTTPFFRAIKIDFPTRGLESGADVRIRRLGIAGQSQHTNHSQLVRFESTRDEPPNRLPANYSIFSARIKADARISGNIPSITAKVSRRIKTYTGYDSSTGLPTGEALEVSSNPAWIYVDALLGVNGEGRVEQTQIDWPTFLRWAEFCDTEIINTRDSGGRAERQKVAEFNHQIGSRTTLERILRDISGSGYASPIMRGTLYSVFWEAEDRAPIALLTPATTKNFSATRDWAEEIHGYRVSYHDPDNNYKSNQVIAYKDGYSESNATIVKDVDARRLGAASRSAAWRYGRYKIADAVLHQEQYRLEIGIDSLFFEVGDVVSLSHDTIQVGSLFGRAEDSSGISAGAPFTPPGGQPLTNPHFVTILLDQDIPVGVLGDVGTVRMRIETQQGVVSSVDGFSARGLLINGIDLGFFLHAFVFNGRVSQADIETRGVTFAVEHSNNLPLDDTAGAYKGLEYSLGSASSDAIPCIVNSISPSGESVARVILREFRPQSLIASWTGNVPDRDAVFSELVDFTNSNAPPRPVILAIYSGSIIGESVEQAAQVSNVFVFFDLVEIGAIDSEIREVVLNWRPTGEAEWKGGTQFADAPAVLADVPVGITFEVRAAYRDKQGRQSSWTTATHFNKATTATRGAGETASPTGLEIEGQGNDTEFRGKGVVIVWRDGAQVVDSEEILGEERGYGQGEVDRNFNGYEVQVLSGSQLLRTAIVYQTRYEYLAEISAFDGGPYRELRFEVSRRDVLLGSGKPAVLDVSNPRPTITASQVAVAVGEGHYIITIADSVLAVPDFAEAIITNTGGDIIDRGYLRRFRVDLDTDEITGEPFVVNVAVADIFGGALTDWNSIAVNVPAVPHRTPLVITDDGSLVRTSDSIPPAPTGLTVTPLVNSNFIQFTDPTTLYGFHGKTIIHRAPRGVPRADSVEIDEVSGYLYLDSAIEPGAGYDYWIRFMPVSGRAYLGPYNSAVATPADSSLFPDSAIENIRADQVTVGRLTGAQIDGGDVRAGSLVSGSTIQSPTIETGLSRSGRFIGGRITGSVIEGAVIIGNPQGITLATEPAENSEGTPLSALQEGVGDMRLTTGQSAHSNLWNGNSDFQGLAVPTAPPAGVTLLYNFFYSGSDPNGVYGSTWTPGLATGYLNIYASNFEDFQQFFRYRWPKVQPRIEFYVPIQNLSVASNSTPFGITFELNCSIYIESGPVGGTQTVHYTLVNDHSPDPSYSFVPGTTRDRIITLSHPTLGSRDWIFRLRLEGSGSPGSAQRVTGVRAQLLPVLDNGWFIFQSQHFMRARMIFLPQGGPSLIALEGQFFSNNLSDLQKFYNGVRHAQMRWDLATAEISDTADNLVELPD